MKLLSTLCWLSFLSMPYFAKAAETAVAPNMAPPANLVRIVISLIFVVGMLIMLAVVFKKFGLNRIHSSFPVKIISATYVGNNQRLMIIEVGEEWIILGVTPHAISKITSMPRQTVDNTLGTMPKPNVPGWMQSALEKYSGKKF